MKKIGILLFYLFTALPFQAQTSVAGLFPISDQGREVWNFNPGWRFHLGDAKGADAKDFDDSRWEVVSTPHCVKLEPAEASGCRNYQGVAWYRKHFTVPADRAELHFEAVMGKQKVYVNGRLVSEHYCGYLPIIVDLRKHGLKKGDDCVVAVMTDNSNDKTYPPGKPQYTLDFAYHGGIYRDVWLIAKNDVAISDVITENKQAGGGIFVHYANISDAKADVFVDTELRNFTDKARTVTVVQTLHDASGKKVKEQTRKVTVPANGTIVAGVQFTVKQPHLWSPETPYLYRVVTRVKDGKNTLDGGMTKIGIRSFEFVNTDGGIGCDSIATNKSRQPGFYLNGKRYRQFVGANRHQDFAYVGNAVPNSQQWLDVVRLKQAGFNIIRTAHYPQDPSFMDACDELGIFIIVATPGWQYWNKNDAVFEERVLQNTREIIRRDRNHPSVLMWEPILNETRFPLDFSLKSLQITKDEYPYPYRPVAAADMHSAGVSENYEVVYGWPGDDEKTEKPRQCIFTREFGELVDDWYAHNNLNRASRSWGERPMLMQAMSLNHSAHEMYRTTGQFIGGCQWHPFDHQRGYHPDPYWGGIYDAFRQPKTALSMFAAALQPNDQQPVVSIAHEMTQFSDEDVTVFSNCDSVRLTMYGGEHTWTLPVNDGYVIFPKAWDFFEARTWSYTKKNWQNVTMVAEGVVDGKVVCRDEKMPSRRSTKLRLRVDNPCTPYMGSLQSSASPQIPLVADGSDFVVVVCEVTDDSGHVRRLAKENIVFTVEGEGEIVGDESIGANPRAVEWGSAPVLIRSTRKAGKIKVHAEVQYPGTHAPTPADLEIESVPYEGQFVLGMGIDEHHGSNGLHRTNESHGTNGAANVQEQLTEEQKTKLLQEVQDQQADFGIGATTQQGKQYRVAACDWMMLKRQKLGEFQLAKDIHADGVEMDMGPLGQRVLFENRFRDPVEVDKFKHVADSLGVLVPSVAMSGFFAQNFITRVNYIDLIADCFQTMNAFGAKVAFLPLGGSGNEWQKAGSANRDTLIHRLHVVGEMAKQNGVVVGIRTQLSAAESIQLLDAVNSDGIKIYYNFQDAADNNRDICEELRLLGRDRICQIHATNTDGVNLREDPEIDMPAIKRVLDEIGWSGWLVVERSRDATKVRDVRYNFGRNVEYLEEIFR